MALDRFPRSYVITLRVIRIRLSERTRDLSRDYQMPSSRPMALSDRQTGQVGDSRDATVRSPRVRPISHRGGENNPRVVRALPGPFPDWSTLFRITLIASTTSLAGLSDLVTRYSANGVRRWTSGPNRSWGHARLGSISKPPVFLRKSSLYRKGPS